MFHPVWVLEAGHYNAKWWILCNRLNRCRQDSQILRCTRAVWRLCPCSPPPPCSVANQHADIWIMCTNHHAEIWFMRTNGNNDGCQSFYMKTANQHTAWGMLPYMVPKKALTSWRFVYIEITCSDASGILPAPTFCLLPHCFSGSQSRGSYQTELLSVTSTSSTLLPQQWCWIEVAK